uniref:Uncharacterized protein n=1 Tax=Ananas comosus var. bracteatus TaxID=296719 RepID=A0A6V7PWP0_ANACO|nr:unnamed protein product [Ananas comosus var. bracteatus]
MPRVERLLQRDSGQIAGQGGGGGGAAAAGDAAEPIAVGSDVVVILAALLCALICVVGLALAARCAWRRSSAAGGAGAGAGVAGAPRNKGLKKKVLRALPKVSYGGAGAAGGGLAECPICLADFVEGRRSGSSPTAATASTSPASTPGSDPTPPAPPAAASSSPTLFPRRAATDAAPAPPPPLLRRRRRRRRTLVVVCPSRHCPLSSPAPVPDEVENEIDIFSSLCGPRLVNFLGFCREPCEVALRGRIYVGVSIGGAGGVLRGKLLGGVEKVMLCHINGSLVPLLKQVEARTRAPMEKGGGGTKGT